jgi:hypothetical protein
MADITPGQFPTDPTFTTVNFKTVTPSLTTVTNSGKMRRVGYGVSFYSFDVQYPPLTPIDAREVQGFLGATLGTLFSFEIVLPKLSYSVSANAVTANATVTTANAISWGANAVMLSNCGANKTILYAGEYFRFANHSKVYMCTNRNTGVQSNAAGYATLTFSGSCVTSVPAGQRVQIDAVPFTVVQAEQEQTQEVSYGGLTTMKLSMREVW